MSDDWMMLTVELPATEALAVQKLLRELGFEITGIKGRPALKRGDGALARWIPIPPGGFVRPEVEDS